MSKTFAMRDGNVLFQANGQAQMLEAYDKVQQDINNALSAPYEPSRDWGNELITGSINVVERASIPGLIQREVGSAIARLRRFQSRINRRFLPPSERITGIRSIVTRPLGNLGIAYLVTVSVASRTAEDVTMVFRISNQHLEG